MLSMFGWKWLLFSILAVAFLLRVGLGIVVQHQLDESPEHSFLIPGDAAGYWELGRKVANGEEYAVYDPPRRVMRMPGFPLLLAASIRLAGKNLLSARILLSIVGTLACGLVFWLGKELFDEQVGTIAAGLTAISPTMAGFSILILSETLFAAGMLASLIAFAKVLQTDNQVHSRWKGWRLSFVTGVLIALACYVRPSWLLAAPLLACLLVIFSKEKKQALVRGTLICLGLAVALLPWTVRNYWVTGRIVATTLWVGPSLYDGLNPQATGGSDMRFFDQDALMSKMPEYEVDRHYRNKAWEFVQENPLKTLQLAGEKFRRFWKPWPNAEQFGSWWAKLSVAGFFLPVVVLAAWGCWNFRKHYWKWILTVGPILYFTAIHLVFVGSLRYRLPAEYALCVMSAAGLQSWFLSQKNRESENEPEKVPQPTN